MRNKFPGPCYRCGMIVLAGEGHFERYRGGWRTQHASCAIKHRNIREAEAKAAQAIAVLLPQVRGGPDHG